MMRPKTTIKYVSAGFVASIKKDPRYPLKPSIIVCFRPSLSQSQAPMSTPGSAMLPRRSCHSAVLLMLPFLTTLEMMVPENTPFGKVTFTYVNKYQARGDWLRHTKSYRNHAPHVPINDFQ